MLLAWPDVGFDKGPHTAYIGLHVYILCALLHAETASPPSRPGSSRAAFRQRGVAGVGCIAGMRQADAAQSHGYGRRLHHGYGY